MALLLLLVLPALAAVLVPLLPDRLPLLRRVSIVTLLSQFALILAQLPSALGGLQHWLAHDMNTESFYHRTVVSLVVGLSRLSSWSDRQLVDGFSGATGEATLQSARRLSFTTSGRTQTYALTLLIGVVLMAAWLLTLVPSPLLR